MDTQILHLFNYAGQISWLDNLMLFVTLGAIPLAPLLIGRLWWQKGRYTGQTALITLGLTLTIALLFQFIGARPRPTNVTLIWPTPNFPSFPSGHATVAWGLAIIWLWHATSWSQRLLTIGTASLISFSRIYLGHHYPTDILGGLILGTGLGLMIAGIRFGDNETKPIWRWLIWPQLSLVILVTMMAYLGALPYHLLAWPGLDKGLHFLSFGLVSFWLNLWVNGRAYTIATRWGQLLIPLAIILPLSVATAEELSQHFSPLRTADIWDWIFDFTGMLFFWYISQQYLDRQHTIHEANT
ncbi:MAG TPA: VanZ family protein [Anaerolineae bacterium]|nr:VanZ family protein [Anaerolineae bacterium]